MEAKLFWLVERQDGDMWPTVLSGPYDSSDAEALLEVEGMIEEAIFQWMQEEGGTQDEMPDYGLLEVGLDSNVLPVISDFEDSYLARRYAAAMQKIQNPPSEERGSLAERDDPPFDPAYVNDVMEEEDDEGVVTVPILLSAPTSGEELEEVFLEV